MILVNHIFILYPFLFWFSKRRNSRNDILFRKFSSIIHTSRNLKYTLERSHYLREIRSNISFIHVYIIWQTIPNLWILKTEHETLLCGKNGFLHEYIQLRYPCQVATIHILPISPSILDIQTFPPGILPDYVQTWLPPCKKADILLFPTHSDDEFVFLCGVIGKYSSNKKIRIQIAYICEFYSTKPIREHEKLNGLWEAGIRHYPITGPVIDFYPKRKADRTVKVYKKLFYSQIFKYVVAQIRKFKPTIVVGHDFLGEYEHPMHVLSSSVIGKAVKITNDADFYPDLASTYGLWDTPKTYIHLYGNEQTDLDIFVPIPSRGNLTGYQIVKQSFGKHTSQIYGRFQVFINGEFKCTSFGLYRSLVGPDKKRNDLFENIER